MRCLDRLPEIQTTPFKELIESGKRLDRHDRSSQKTLIVYVLKKLIDNFNVPTVYGTTKEEKHRTIALWISALCDLTPAAIIKGLYQIISGRTGYVEFPPRNGIAFHCVCTSSSHIELSPKINVSLLTPGRDEATRTKGLEYLAKMKVMLRGSYKNVSHN